MPKPPKKNEKDLDDWLAILTLLWIGVILVGWGITNGWNFVLIVFGLVFGGASILGTPEFRLYLKLTINRISGKEVFQIQEVRDSTVYQGGIHYHEAPGKKRIRDPNHTADASPRSRVVD